MSETPIRRSSRATAAAHPDWDLDLEIEGGTLAPREQLPAQDAEYVETPRRAIAFVLDVLFVQMTATMLLQVMAFIAGMTVLQALPGGVQDKVFQSWIGFLVPTLLVGVFQAVVHVYFWRVWRQSPGQHLVGIYTVRADNGQRLSKRLAIVRWLVLLMPAWLVAGSSNLGVWYSFGVFKGVDQSSAQTTANGLAITLPVIWWTILLITTLVARNGRGLHDRISRAVVVEPR
jgi:hypothetical protein